MFPATKITPDWEPLVYRINGWKEENIALAPEFFQKSKAKIIHLSQTRFQFWPLIILLLFLWASPSDNQGVYKKQILAQLSFHESTVFIFLGKSQFSHILSDRKFITFKLSILLSYIEQPIFIFIQREKYLESEICTVSIKTHTGFNSET